MVDVNRYLTLDVVVGTAVLWKMIVGRSRGLALQGVLDSSRASGSLTSAWVSELNAKVTAHVPAGAQRDQMIAATSSIEAALTSLSTAVASYAAAYKVVAESAHQDAHQ